MQIFSDSNLKRLRTAHKKVVANTATAIAVEMAAAGQRGVDYAKSHPRFTPQSGNLQRKNEWRTIKIGNGRILRMRNTAKYAAAIDQGARPHPIVGSPLLRFFWKKKGRWVSTRRVRHPGNKPYRFLYGATTVAGQLLGRGLTASMTKIAKQF